jgi:hypothetical protein
MCDNNNVWLEVIDKIVRVGEIAKEMKGGYLPQTGSPTGNLFFLPSITGSSMSTSNVGPPIFIGNFLGGNMSSRPASSMPMLPPITRALDNKKGE